ncbi:Hypothetical_protein [Hexamita inflata]|uniref:Hypothetical_protein n=1 Tax=Hexamita inflata TaxID=28002 RepID=A0AA86U8U7_9EUKA|nr:Hypothetical protein HINF_LOCUS31006 [Hexamita inflata]
MISTSKIISFDNIRIQPNDCEPDLNYYDMKKAQVLVIGISHNDFTDKAKRYANPRFYNAHSRVLYHYQAPESRETYDQFETVTREYKTYQHIFIPNYTSCPNSELVEVRRQWGNCLVQELQSLSYSPNLILVCSSMDDLIQLWEVELLFLVYYVSNYILKYFATSNADDKFQQIISSWRLFMNYSLTQEGQKYDFDRIRPQSTIQSRYLIFQKGKIEITTCNKRTAMTKINAVEDVQGRSTNSLNKLRQF